MAKYLIIFCIIFLLSGCGFSQKDLPVLRSNSDTEANDTGDANLAGTPDADESPRTTAEFDIPPTWTPGALVDSPFPSNSEPASTVEITVDSSADSASGSMTYEVQPGDTLAEIAIQFNVTLDAIAAANGIENLDHIEVGQILTIPG